jgi:hypothetical protein
MRVVCQACDDEFETTSSTVVTCGCGATIKIRAVIRTSGPCVYCGEVAAEVDHVTPRSRGGQNTAANMVPACGACNRAKGRKLLSEWILLAPTKVGRGCAHSEKVAGVWYDLHHPSDGPNVLPAIIPECICFKCQFDRFQYRNDTADAVGILYALSWILHNTPAVGIFHDADEDLDDPTRYGRVVRDIARALHFTSNATVEHHRADYWRQKLLMVLYGYKNTLYDLKFELPTPFEISEPQSALELDPDDTVDERRRWWQRSH